MGLVLLIILIGLFCGTMMNVFNVGWLLVYSTVLFLYTVMIGVSKHTSLSNMGRVLCAASFTSVVFCFYLISGVNVRNLF